MLLKSRKHQKRNKKNEKLDWGKMRKIKFKMKENLKKM